MRLTLPFKSSAVSPRIEDLRGRSYNVSTTSHFIS
uniref:Uncharacterized protein n=1 Tax=Anguilla anguilla TaxID=7936 RepID=A0A0E9PCU3_ANGAN